MNKYWDVTVMLRLKTSYEVHGRDEDDAIAEAEAQAIDEYGDDFDIEIIDIMQITDDNYEDRDR